MRISNNPLLPALIVIIAGVLGWLLMRDAIEPTLTRSKDETSQPTIQHDTSPAPASSLGNRGEARSGGSIEDLISLPNERLVRFSSEEAYREALRRLGDSGLKNLGQLDSLRVLRLGYRDLKNLEDWLDDDAETFRNFFSRIPDLPDVADQPNAVPFGDSMLEFLGITEDNSSYGEGLTLAVVDTGVSPHRTLPNVLEQINFMDLADGTTQHGHGTAVASLAAGQDPRLRGVAPGAEIQPYRVANESGLANDFSIMQAFTDAAEKGIPYVITALGGYGRNQLMQELVNQFAENGGPVIIASSGNDGANTIAYPAGYDNVYSVGAIDRNGNAMNFSNRGETLDFAGPGNQVLAAWPGDRAIAFTGTSAPPGIIAGMAAAIQSESGHTLTPRESMDVLVSYLNEAGKAGPDPIYGNGIPHLGRALRRDQPNIEDLAVASHHYFREDGLLQVNVQNQGTTTSPQATLDVNLGTYTTETQVRSLAPGEVFSRSFPAGQSELEQNGHFDVASTVQSRTSSRNDIDPGNNVQRDQITTPEFDAQQAK